jgi:hypothetical protein
MLTNNELRFRFWERQGQDTDAGLHAGEIPLG